MLGQSKQPYNRGGINCRGKLRYPKRKEQDFPEGIQGSHRVQINQVAW